MLSVIKKVNIYPNTYPKQIHVLNKTICPKIVDDNTVFEIMPDFAQNILCCFARMEGRTVGVTT